MGFGAGGVPEYGRNSASAGSGAAFNKVGRGDGVAGDSPVGGSSSASPLSHGPGVSSYGGGNARASLPSPGGSSLSGIDGAAVQVSESAASHPGTGSGGSTPDLP